MYKIGKRIRDEKIFYVCSDISKLISENKKSNYESFAEYDCILDNLHYLSTKCLLKKTLFKNYGFLLKDTFHLIVPSRFMLRRFVRVLNRIDLIGLKLNNNFYLKKEGFNLFLELSYEKSVLLFTSFLHKCLKYLFIFVSK